MPTLNELRARLDEYGYALLEQILGPGEAIALAEELGATLEALSEETGVRRAGGHVYAARNLGLLWPRLREVSSLVESRAHLREIMGPSARLVRALYFDKPPHGPWSLPWHRDTNVAVSGTAVEGINISVRAGVPHVRASECILSRMLSIRLHLDNSTSRNGALWVRPGSHLLSTEPDGEQVIEAEAGSVLLMRPLLLHRSRESTDPTRRRRVLHLEYAVDERPAPNMSWADVYPTDRRSLPVNEGGE